VFSIVLKIDRVSERQECVVFVLSGRVQSEEDVADLRKLISSEKQKVVLDMKQVNLVDRAAVKFLAECQAEGIELRNVSRYISQWICREAATKGDLADKSD
jgi:ABC-type transporter Mla MlaB component